VVAVDPGKAAHRVWLADRERGLIGEPVTVANSRSGIEQLAAFVGGGDPVFAVEATGSLHRAFAGELERRWPGALRMFAPSETQAARAQIGARRFKTDDRDCAALVWLARQGAGRPAVGSPVEAMLAAVAHRRQLVLALTPLRQRVHDQLNALAPGLSAPGGHGRALLLDTPTGRAVLACAIDFEGRAPSLRSLKARAGGRLTDATAAFWAGRWQDCLAPPADAALRAQRLGRDVDRFWALRGDIAFVDAQLQALLADSAGQILTSLPGVKVVRAAAFAAHSLPIERFPTPEHLYSATGLAPSSYQSASIRKRAAISRTGLPEHRDALMGIAWGLGQPRPRLPGPPPRTQPPRPHRHPRPRRAGPPRLPALLAPASNPTALRRSALRSRQARPRTVTARQLCRADGAI
jgi:transposase